MHAVPTDTYLGCFRSRDHSMATATASGAAEVSEKNLALLNATARQAELTNSAEASNAAPRRQRSLAASRNTVTESTTPTTPMIDKATRVPAVRHNAPSHRLKKTTTIANPRGRLRCGKYDGKTLMANTLSWLQQTEGTSGGGFFATHPATGDRVAAVRRLPDRPRTSR